MLATHNRFSFSLSLFLAIFSTLSSCRPTTVCRRGDSFWESRSQVSEATPEHFGPGAAADGSGASRFWSLACVLRLFGGKAHGRCVMVSGAPEEPTEAFRGGTSRRDRQAGGRKVCEWRLKTPFQADVETFGLSGVAWEPPRASVSNRCHAIKPDPRRKLNL